MSETLDSIFLGSSEMARRMRELDWTKTSLGPPESWPRSLRTVVRVLLTSRYQMWMGWGEQLTFLFNDAYRPTLGVKHVRALGAPAAEVWAEIWPEIEPRIATVMTEGEATWDEGLLLLLERNGYPEETYHTFSYSPLHDDEGIVRGLLCVVTEETHRVLGARRTATLRDLASGLAVAQANRDVFDAIDRAIETNRNDMPFAAVYFVDRDADARVANVVSEAGFVGAFADAIPRRLALDEGQRADDVWTSIVRNVLDTNTSAVFDVPAAPLPAGPWARSPREALALPLTVQPGRPAGVLIAGRSPHRVLDDELRGFFELFAGQVSAALAAASAFEEEKRRAEALAAIDRAKTAFFSNVSHEFRTPLTLMLGPLEDAVGNGALVGEDLRIAHRNTQRLLKLVNTLLDFSRIEAGRVTAVYRPTNLGSLTRDLASSFRAAIERAGLRFVVEIEDLPQPTYVDESMWEKIVLNLLSNAMKFTFEGGVTVTLSQRRSTSVELSVSDTGVGIPAEELPRVFERFHRVENTRARTHEGSGIGMALVAELVRLHGGTVTCESTIGAGTTFTVSLPTGRAHLPPDRVADAPAESAGATFATSSFVAEALRWLPGDRPSIERPAALAIGDGSSDAERPPPARSSWRGRILLADDNADMREYARRLLEGRWDVETVADGLRALDSARRTRPDLIITDVMMPNLDGFGLVRALRDDPALRAIPVIMLSARAGEEARIEGIDAGAADYIVKPFTARELVARVRARLDVARLEQVVEVERWRLHALFMNAPAFICVFGGPEHRFELANAHYVELVGGREVIGKTVREALPDIEGQGYYEMLDEVYRTGAPLSLRAARVVLERDGQPTEHFLDFVYQPRFDADGRIDGILVFGFEVTEQVRARRLVESESKKKDEFLAMLAHELRNPLAPVRLAVGLAKTTRDAARLGNQLDIIDRQSANLARIVDDLLDVSRITRGLVHLQNEQLDIEVVLRRAIDANAGLIEQRRHELTIAAPHPPVFVAGDPVRLEQIFVNLLTNAAKYTNPGGAIRVNVQRVPSSSSDGDVVVRVTDNGIGIAPHVLARVFDLFHQAERGLDRAEGGLGIGLTVVKNLVELHGGSIAAHSDGAGAGSEFVVRLPAVAAPTAAAGPSADDASRDRKSSVLVVDDNVDAAESLADLLSSWGHDVSTVFDGPSALAAIERSPPDYVFLDLGLPGMNGYEVARAVRASSAGARVQLIALSGYGQPDDRDRATGAGFDGHLVKPASIEALRNALHG